MLPFPAVGNRLSSPGYFVVCPPARDREDQGAHFW